MLKKWSKEKVYVRDDNAILALAEREYKFVAELFARKDGDVAAMAEEKQPDPLAEFADIQIIDSLSDAFSNMMLDLPTGFGRVPEECSRNPDLLDEHVEAYMIASHEKDMIEFDRRVAKMRQLVEDNKKHLAREYMNNRELIRDGGVVAPMGAGVAVEEEANHMADDEYDVFGHVGNGLNDAEEVANVEMEVKDAQPRKAMRFNFSCHASKSQETFHLE